MEEVAHGIQNFSNAELEQEAFKICKQEVKIDENITVGNNTLVTDEDILAVFVQKQSGIGAVQAPPHNSISTGPEEQGWAIVGVGRRCMLFGNPSVRFFRRSRT
jgi:hypothetical protein